MLEKRVKELREELIINREKLQDQTNFYGIETNGNDEFLEPGYYDKRDAWIAKSKKIILEMEKDHKLLENQLFRKTKNDEERERITMESH